MPRRTSATLTLVAAATLVGGLTATAVAQAHPAPTRARLAAATATRHIAKYGSSAKLPTSKKHASGGAVNLTEDGKLQRYVNRSNSPRPTVVHRNGRTMLRSASSTVSWLPTVPSTPIVNNSKPGQLNAWEGLNEYDNGQTAGFSLEPPDQGMCAGNGHVLEMINDVVQVYSSNGTAESPAIYLNDFFQEPGYQFTTDPSCVYDAGSNRFFATQLTLDTNQKTGALTGKDWLDIAVSKTGDPLGGYNYYRIYVTDDGTDGTPSHRGCPCIGDYPHLGTDTNGLYLTTNEYPFSSAPGVYGNNFNGAQLYALSKHALATGAQNPEVFDYQDLRVPSTNGPTYVGFTLWPAQSAGKAYNHRFGGTMSFLSSYAAEEARPDDFTGHASMIGYWRLSHTHSLRTSSPHLVLRQRTLNTGAYGLPPISSQKVGPTPLRDCLTVGCHGVNDQYAPEQEGGLDSSDTRMLTAGYANGIVYGALDTAVQVNGNVQAGFQYYEVNVTHAPVTLAGQGYVGAAGENVSYPAIATDPSGNGYLGVTLAGKNYYPSAAYMTWTNGAGPILYVSGRGRAPQDGFCEYLYFNCAGTQTPQIRPRWGDYGYAAWDGQQFFVANEWIAHRCTFATFDSDPTCGGTRTFYGNFSTHIARLASPTSS